MTAEDDLVTRVEARLPRVDAFERREMFGGTGFLLNGHMCVGVYRDELILRVGPATAAELLSRDGYRPFDITGRPMRGWVMAGPVITADDGTLDQCIARAMAFVDTLPPKSDSQKDDVNQRIRDLRNLGPSSARMLATAGIETRGDLARLGPVKAYLAVQDAAGRKPSLNLLWAMSGALEGIGWNALSRERRGELLRELDAAIDMRSWPVERP